MQNNGAHTKRPLMNILYNDKPTPPPIRWDVFIKKGWAICEVMIV